MNKFVEKHPGLIIIIVGGLGILGCIAGFSYFFQSKQSFGFTSNTSGVPTSTLNSISNPVSNGLIGWWTFDGQDMITNSTTASSTILDRTGNNNGLVSTSTKHTAGKLGQAYNFNGYFNGVNEQGQSYIDLGNSPTLDVGTTFSLSMWVNFTETSSTVTEFAFRKSANYGFRMHKTIGSTGMVFDFHPADGSQYAVTSTLGINDGKWHLVTGVYDHIQLKMYTDGVLTLGDSTSTQPFFQNELATIGTGSNQFNRPFMGSIDDVRIYNRALSAAEVQQLYKLGK